MHEEDRAIRDATLDCVHCGLCLEDCPTYRVTGRESANPRGRIVLMQGLLEERIAPTSEVLGDLDLCLVCRACETACPSGVRYGSIIEHVRERTRSPSWTRRRAMALLGRPRTLATLFFLARLWQKLPEGLRQRLLPRGLARKEALLPTLTRPATGKRREDGPRGEVLLFSGCVQPRIFPGVGLALRRLVKATGHGFHTPQAQTCCGALHAHDGDGATAASWLQRNVRAFAHPDAPPILVDAAGCGAALAEAAHRLPDDPEAARFGTRVLDATRWLREHGADLTFRSAEGLRATHAAPCHLHHAQGDTAGPLPLLERVPDLDLVPLENADRCCGAAGIYNVDQPATSQTILEERLDALERSGARLLLTGNPGCVIQWRAGIRQRGLDVAVLHPLEFLAEHLATHTPSAS